ncbi:MAG: hypothetical protein R6V83_05010 [Candidatus Thorarchaeota archaeon]
MVLRSDLDLAFAKLMNPRMSAGLMVLYSLLDPLQGEPLAPMDVRDQVNEWFKERNLSKQSITNAARRLEEAKIISREEGYTANYGYIISVLLNQILELSDRVRDLEDEIEEMKHEVDL